MTTAPADNGWQDMGCHKSCRLQHSDILGLCALADTRPIEPPGLTILRMVTAPNGEQVIATEQLTFMALTDVAREAMKEVLITIGPNSLHLMNENKQLRLTDGEYQSMALAVADALTRNGLDS